MTTRFYFSNVVAPVSPAFGAWDYTAEAIRREIVRERGLPGEVFALGTQIGPWTAGQTALDRQYVSGPIAAQTIGGTVQCQIRAREFAADDNVVTRFHAFVVSNDGSVLRGTLLALGYYGPVTPVELVNSATLRNASFAIDTAVTPVVCLDGDRVVVEIGYTDDVGTTPEAQSDWGAPAAPPVDLPENETTTTQGPPWVEFIPSLLFLLVPTIPNISLEEGYIESEFASATVPALPNRSLESGYIAFDVAPATEPTIPNRSLEYGYVTDTTGPFVRNFDPIYVSELDCAPIETDVRFQVGTRLPRTVDLSTMVVRIQVNFAAPVTVYDGGSGGFQAGYTGTVVDVSTAFENIHDVVVNPNVDLPFDANVRVFVEAEDDLGEPIAPPEFWDFCTLPDLCTLISLDRYYVEQDGGYQVTIFGAFPEDEYYVHVGPLASTNDPRCYSGIAGQGDVIRPTASGTELRIVTPPLPVGGPYSFFFDAVNQIGIDKPSCDALLVVTPKTFKSKTFELRRLFPPKWKTGPRRIDREEYPQ